MRFGGRQRTVMMTVNGQAVEAPQGTVMAALMSLGAYAVRISATGQQRGPLCGMGVCHECRVQINGERGVLACMTDCEPGMDIRTDVL